MLLLPLLAELFLLAFGFGFMDLRWYYEEGG